MSFSHESEHPTSQWFAVCTLSRHEKRVAEVMTERQLQCFLPLYHLERQWKKRPPVMLDLPLFPTYLFARITPRERGAILRIPGVVSIIGNGRQPLPVANEEIEALRTGLQVRSVEHHPYLAVGERVRVNRGLLRGVEGLLVRRNNRFRVVISVVLIQQSISVEVDCGDIEALSAPMV